MACLGRPGCTAPPLPFAPRPAHPRAQLTWRQGRGRAAVRGSSSRSPWRHPGSVECSGCHSLRPLGTGTHRWMERQGMCPCANPERKAQRGHSGGGGACAVRSLCPGSVCRGQGTPTGGVHPQRVSDRQALRQPEGQLGEEAHGWLPSGLLALGPSSSARTSLGLSFPVWNMGWQHWFLPLWVFRRFSRIQAGRHLMYKAGKRLLACVGC